ncbi:LysR family transcriptional regulator, partial [Shigella flexneri]|nr:LysR family transcriptional regulator [Shigella flexneri]
MRHSGRNHGGKVSDNLCQLIHCLGNDSNLLIVFYVQIMP